MSELKQFRLPDVGEGLTEADIVKWHVQPGDPVRINQIVVEIETAKAVVELPSPFEGVVDGLLAAEGATVDVGTPILSVSTGEAGALAPAAAGSRPSPPPRARTFPLRRPRSRPRGWPRRRLPTRPSRRPAPRPCPRPRPCRAPRRPPGTGRSASPCWSGTA